jgi:acyl-CoA thioesterase FadM
LFFHDKVTVSMSASTTSRPTDAAVRVAIRPSDLGPTGHVHQSRFHEYLGEGRAAIMAAHGCDARDFVVARIELDHRGEIGNDEKAVQVGGRVAAVGSSSVRIELWIALPDGAVVAEGASVLVAWDATVGAKRAIGDDERARLER